MMPSSRNWIVPAEVVRIIDGDTIVLTLDLGWYVRLADQHIRIAYINSPELPTPEGKAALAFAQTIVKPGDTVVLTSLGKDKYGRWLGTVTLPGGEDYGEKMLKNGSAVIY
jgi:endonuclease YncB( thermonuclease family)